MARRDGEDDDDVALALQDPLELPRVTQRRIVSRTARSATESSGELPRGAGACRREPAQRRAARVERLALPVARVLLHPPPRRLDAPTIRRHDQGRRPPRRAPSRAATRPCSRSGGRGRPRRRLRGSEAGARRRLVWPACGRPAAAEHPFTSKTALVTGSSGLIGSEAVRSTSAAGPSTASTTCAASSSASTGTRPGTSSGFVGDEPVRASRPRRPRPRRRRAPLRGAALRPSSTSGAAVARPRRVAALRRLRGERARDAEPARSGPAHCPETPFVFMSTNKVYGDAPNELPLVELETR